MRYAFWKSNLAIIEHFRPPVHNLAREVFFMRSDYITFRSVTVAQRGERLLKNSGIDCILQRTPRWMEERGCGYCLRVRPTDIPEGLILHSDQGWQYQHLRYQKALKDRNIIQSMSRKGNCLDNAMMENFFGLMKSELLYLQEWDSVEQFAKELVKYIRYYNNDRIKLRLNGKSPVQYRALFQSKSAS